MRLLTSLLAASGCLATVWYAAEQNLPAPIDAILRAQMETAASHYSAEILRDEWGIPHVFGVTDADASFGLAYAHAEDDFATIQDVILTTRGRLATHKGWSAVKTDYLVQWMGVWDAVNSSYQQRLSPEGRAMAEAYAAGINLYAVQHPDAVARALLPVTGKDLVAGFTFKTPMFYGFDKALGELLNSEQPLELAVAGDDALSWQPLSNLPIGSQGIAVAPHRSSDGATRLLVNSHQPLTGPVAWYEASIHSDEGLDMAGSTFPGSPVIIHGHNRDVAWANTVNKPDLVDIYRLSINPENANEYRLDGEWVEFEREPASMTVKLFGPLHWTFDKDVLRSQHGPVMETEHGVYALRWAGMQESRTLDFMLALNKARNLNDFEAALRLQAMPSINYVYADRAGNIAHYYNAQFPQRIEGWDWSKVLPGDRSELIWQGYRPFAQMPKTVNPASGLVYNANNPPFQATDGDDDPRAEQFPASMGIESVITNRALQIEALYGDSAQISPQQFETFKYDVDYHPHSYQLTGLNAWLSDAHERFVDTDYAAALEDLRSWSGSFAQTDNLAALAALTLAPFQAANTAQVADTLVDEAFRTAVDGLVDAHGQHRLPFGEVNRHVRGDLSLPLSGAADTLRAVYGGELNDEGFWENRAGDSYVMFISWPEDGEVQSRAVHNFGSATLDTTSPHYADQAPLFANEQLRAVYFDRAQIERQAVRRYRPQQYSDSAAGE
ncbi:penicillin acylase family protein [Microbulbifer agarilyticus]|uniref:penicillin acylase family protein n=1 Tax=Microbulbifer agarilyticus TaxID=260552 RepID=UPI001CD72458|nr:penicillin acylase family protein [Microbulbifer agarilyticus]MCA0902164.1 penicillin acylase family protein [Microbulbifer agarilyticus]